MTTPSLNRRLSPPSAGLPPVCDADIDTDDESLSPEALHDDTPLPPELAFTPVVRRRRTNGMTAVRQRAFIRALAITGSVRDSLRAIGATKNSVYLLRDAPGGESFAAAWDVAPARGRGIVLDVMYDHAVNGVPQRVYKDGKLVAERRVFNTRAQMWIVDRDAKAKGAAHQPAELTWEQRRDERNQRLERILATLIKIRTSFLIAVGSDVVLRAAWETIVGPLDWDNLDDLGPPKAHDPSSFIPTIRAIEMNLAKRYDAG